MYDVHVVYTHVLYMYCTPDVELIFLWRKIVSGLVLCCVVCCVVFLSFVLF